MKNKIPDHNPLPSGLFRSNFRRYFKRGKSPDLLNLGFLLQKSNQQLLSQPQSPPKQNLRYSQKPTNINLISTQLPKRQNSLLDNISQQKIKQKIFIGDYRKKDKLNIYKKFNNINHNSSLFFQNSHKGPNTTKQASKANSYSQLCSLESKTQNQIQQLHYQMVLLQQKCKNIVGN